MATPTLGGVTLTGCSQIGDAKTGNIVLMPMPLGDSDETELFDFGGVEQTFNVQGVFAESTVAATKVKVDAIKALIDGDQASTVTFSSDQTGSIPVMVMAASFNWDVPGFTCQYTIKLGRGSAI